MSVNYGKQEYPLLVLGMICLAISSGALSLAPYFFGKVINYSIPGTNWYDVSLLVCYKAIHGNCAIDPLHVHVQHSNVYYYVWELCWIFSCMILL